MTLRLMPSADGPMAVAWSNRMRERRFRLFERLTASLPRPLSVLDVGGRVEFWEQNGWAGRRDVHITLINLTAQDARHPNIESTAGDATDLREYPAGHFDLAFSNSVIEHLETFERQRLMADEMQRVGRSYWVQTPNYWFPIEPHFYVPGWQWLPRRTRIALVQRFRCGCRGPCTDPQHAAQVVDEVRLLNRAEMAALFPNATLTAERVGGLAKSWIAYGGGLQSASMPCLSQIAA